MKSIHIEHRVKQVPYFISHQLGILYTAVTHCLSFYLSYTLSHSSYSHSHMNRDWENSNPSANNGLYFHITAIATVKSSHRCRRCCRSQYGKSS